MTRDQLNAFAEREGLPYTTEEQYRKANCATCRWLSEQRTMYLVHAYLHEPGCQFFDQKADDEFRAMCDGYRVIWCDESFVGGIGEGAL